MNGTEFLKYFQDFLGFQVPLGVCLVVLFVIHYLYSKLQSERRKDFESVITSVSNTNQDLKELLKDREDRIKDLEKRIDK